MKKILRYAFFAMALAAMTSCSDQFLQDKKDYNGFNEEIYDDIALATGKVDFVYGLCLPTTASGVGHSNPCTGRADAFSQSTEEYAGSTTFTQLAEILSRSYNRNSTIHHNQPSINPSPPKINLSFQLVSICLS